MIHHFFESPKKLFDGIGDPREQDKIDYSLECVFFTGLLMYLTRLGARQLVSSNLRDGSPEIQNLFKLMFDAEGVPIGDTVNNLFCAVDVEQVQSCVHAMASAMIRKKVLSSQRLLDKYYTIAFDGTQLFSFPERHCKHCLTRTHNGVTTYYHVVLEAKLVAPCGLVMSVMSEFVENLGVFVDKQDCELKALYRLLPRLKKAFPKLPICLLLDGLYPNGEVFHICEQNDWKYIISFSDDQLKNVHEEYHSLLRIDTQNRLTINLPKSITQEFQWATEIVYKDTHGRLHEVHVVECKETKRDKSVRFKLITNIKPTKENVPDLCKGGRLRWKIENEGFNVQKNNGFNLEHAYSRDPVGWKVFYLLLQMAATIEQLLRKSNLLSEELIKSAKSSKNLALKLLEALRNYALDVETYRDILHQRIQIRFSFNTS